MHKHGTAHPNLAVSRLCVRIFIARAAPFRRGRSLGLVQSREAFFVQISIAQLCTEVKISRPPWRLRGCRVGWVWLVPAEGVRDFDRQPTGMHLPAGEDGQKSGPSSSCPECGERFLAPRDVARTLQKSTSYVHASLVSRPALLRAFRVGSCWIVPEGGLESYRQANERSAPHQRNSGLDKKVVIVRQETCRCER